MPWDTNDYPNSFKNLDTPIRKKAIDIANALIDDGYEDDQAIPIATEQAKEWYENATENDVNQVIQMTDQDLRESDDNRSSKNPDLIDNTQHVVPHEDGWAVKTANAERASNVFSTKEEAIERAEEIAKNKQVAIIIHKKDGSIQRQIDKYNNI